MSGFVVFCPKCLSSDIERDMTFRTYAQGSFFNARTCKLCGYSSIFFPAAEGNELARMRMNRLRGWDSEPTQRLKATTGNYDPWNASRNSSRATDTVHAEEPRN